MHKGKKMSISDTRDDDLFRRQEELFYIFKQNLK